MLSISLSVVVYDLQGILEALEFKLKHGWKPERTLYVAFGHDEEVIVLCCALFC